jgi:enoyl-[acyl-carrier protein] reductase II
VAAVGNAGGMGVLGPNAGQTVVTRDAEGTAENMRAEIRKVRELTDAPFAVNVLPTQGREDIYTPPMLKVIYEEKVPAAVFVGEPDAAMFAELKEHGVKIIYRSLNPSPANAREAEAAGADIIVATGL